MRVLLEINGFDVGPYIEEDGLKPSKEIRNEKSVIAKDGTKWYKNKEKLNLDVNLLDMSDEQFTDFCRHLRPNPASVTYTDFERGTKMQEVPFYVSDLSYTNKKAIDDITYLTDISFKLIQK